MLSTYETYLMYYYREATLDNVLDRAIYWFNSSTLNYDKACFAWNEV